MKHFIYHLFIYALPFFISCNTRHTAFPSVLEQADSLSATNPEQAIIMLDSIHSEMERADSASMMYYHLLKIKARDRAYIRHTSDQEILTIVNYFERHPQDDLLAWSYCYAGRIYRDLNDNPRALRYLEMSLNELEDGQNPNLRQRVLSQIGYLFYYQYLFPESRAIKHEVIAADSLLGNYGKMITCYTDIARTYIAEEKYDSASAYAHYARILASQHPKYQQRSELDLLDAQIAINRNQYDDALRLVTPYLTNAKLADASPFLLVACRAHLALSQYQEAAQLCEQLSENPHIRMASKVDTYKYLSQISDAKGDTRQALAYQKQALKAMDSLVKSEKEEKITLISSYYQSQKQERQLQQLQQEKQDAEIRFYIILFISVCLLLAAGIVWIQIKHRQTERLLAKERILTQFKSTELCQRIYALYYAQRPIKAEMWEEIEDYINDQYPHFLGNLRALSNYTDTEWHLSLLTRLDFRNIEIATLLCKHKSAISLAKKRLYMKVKGVEGKAEDWDNLLQRL